MRKLTSAADPNGPAFAANAARMQQRLDEVRALEAKVVAAGGNTGGQAATMVIRAMSLGEISPAAFLRVAWKELRVGLALGVDASRAMLALALSALAITAFSVLTDRPRTGTPIPGKVTAERELILEGRIRLKRNPVLISAMMSAVTETDRWDNKWLSKQRAINKIDAAVALCMAVGAAMAGDTSGSIDDWLKSLTA